MSEPSTPREGDEQGPPSPGEDPARDPQQQDPQQQGPQGADGGLTDAGMVLSRAVLGVARVLLRQGRRRARKAAEAGRVHLDLRQLRRDRDVMFQKLGREVVHLVEGGEVDHPGLVRGVGRIRELDQSIAQVEEELRRRQEAEQAAATATTQQQQPEQPPVAEGD